MRIVGYFTSWGVQWGYHPRRIPAEKLTHLNYAFAGISPSANRCLLGDAEADVTRRFLAHESVDGQPDGEAGLHGNFNQLRKLKQKHPHLKVLISIGGWTGSDRFSDIALTGSTRREFVTSCIDLFFEETPGVFDGIDLDWEFPVAGGLKTGRAADRRNFTLLLAEFRLQLDQLQRPPGSPPLLTIATSARPAEYANLELDAIHPYVDWINLMTYDFHILTEPVTNFNAPLYASPTDPDPDPVIRERFNLDAAVRGYLSAGVPAHKLVVGVPFYGRGWQGVAAANHGLYQIAPHPAAGTREPGTFDYYDLASNYLPVYERHWHPEACVPWLYNPPDGTFITYDDPVSIAQKVKYVQDNQLGGLMCWELSSDDPAGTLIQTLSAGITRNR